MAKAGSHLELVVSESMQLKVDAAPLKPRRAKKSAKITRPIKTYEAELIFETDPNVIRKFRFRLPELTKQQLRSDGKFVGDVSWPLPNGKWTSFKPGMIDQPSPTIQRFIREIDGDE